MDAELERLRLENARLRKDRDQILAERNQYLSQFQQERTRNTEMSNQILALDSTMNDLKRSNEDLSEKLERAISEKATADREQTLSSDRTASSAPRHIPRASVSVEIPIAPQSRPFRITCKRSIVMSDEEEEEEFLHDMKVEARSPTLAEQKPPSQEENSLPERSSLDESDSDADPFAHDFELLQQEQSSVSPQSSSVSEEEDAPRTFRRLKRKRNAEETVLATPVPSYRIIRPRSSTHSLPPHSKPASEPSSSRLGRTPPRHAAQIAQHESNEEEHSDDDEGDKPLSSPPTHDQHSSAFYIVPRKRGRPPNSSLFGRKRLKKAGRYPCPVPRCNKTFTRSTDVDRHITSSSAHPEITVVDESKRCQYCSADLSRSDARRRHERTNACGKRNLYLKAERAAEAASVSAAHVRGS